MKSLLKTKAMIPIDIMKQYVGTKLKCELREGNTDIVTLIGLERMPYDNFWHCKFKEVEGWWHIGTVFPILHPLSDLTKEMNIGEFKFIPLDTYYGIGHYSKDYIRTKTAILNMRHSFVNKLYSWHFDVHGLIDSKDAIDVNSLKASDS